MLGLLEKHCSVCGMDVDKNTALKRFGKYFCSEDHADRYAEMRIAKEGEDDGRHPGGRSGCCC
jgi:hypothetical protein